MEIGTIFRLKFDSAYYDWLGFIDKTICGRTNSTLPNCSTIPCIYEFPISWFPISFHERQSEYGISLLANHYSQIFRYLICARVVYRANWPLYLSSSSSIIKVQLGQFQPWNSLSKFNSLSSWSICFGMFPFNWNWKPRPPRNQIPSLYWMPIKQSSAASLTCPIIIVTNWPAQLQRNDKFRRALTFCPVLVVSKPNCWPHISPKMVCAPGTLCNPCPSCPHLEETDYCESGQRYREIPASTATHRTRMTDIFVVGIRPKRRAEHQRDRSNSSSSFPA